MITIIMSVGFSVDYSAHIAYGYVVSKEQQPCERVRDALGDLGWPVVQGATSTVLAVAVLADVPAYMILHLELIRRNYLQEDQCYLVNYVMAHSNSKAVTAGLKEQENLNH
ncbi:unnamed protein product [Strongylus vulgaris]|uniref:Uncharacterized protein n=1 Tax=Strongylus vulgaris TaxID=40348 RepID=A0A3P7IGL3_STRVU|nr:unnamed protein product [Strongylus vulgaris]